MIMSISRRAVASGEEAHQRVVPCKSRQQGQTRRPLVGVCTSRRGVSPAQVYGKLRSALRCRSTADAYPRFICGQWSVEVGHLTEDGRTHIIE